MFTRIEKELKENLVTKIGGKKIKINGVNENNIPSLDFKIKNKEAMR